MHSRRDDAAELALGHCHQREQWLRRNESCALLLLDREVADLRAVAVHERDAPPLVEKFDDAVGHGACVGRLFLVSAGLVLNGERVPTQCDHGYLGHSAPTRVHDDPYSLAAASAFRLSCDVNLDDS